MELTEDQIKAGVKIKGPWEGKTEEEMIKTVLSRQLNANGAHPDRFDQAPREPEDYSEPFFRLHNRG